MDRALGTAAESGAVAAKLQTGDRDGARRAFDILRSRAGRNQNDLRSRIVLAHLEAPDRWV